jgi:hypothetical protein
VGTFTFWVLVVAGATCGALAFVAILVSVVRALMSSRVRLETLADPGAPEWFDDIEGRQDN